MDAAAHRHLLEALREAARRRRHRRLLVYSGEAAWCRPRAAEALQLLAEARDASWWLGTHPAPGAVAVDARRVLGGECGLLVIDAHDGLDPDAFGALSGTLRGGGLCLLLTPPWAHWPTWPDPMRARITVAGYPETAVGGRYLARLARQLAADPRCIHWPQGRPCPPPPPLPSPAPAPSPPPDPHCATADQAQAVAAVCKAALGPRRRPALLVADRGRGKSAALGIAAARVLLAGRRHILVTAPHAEGCRTLFQHARRVLGLPPARGLHLHHEAGEIRYLVPERLLHEAPPADLVLVDEAAALPTHLLEALLARYPRLAFATTVHGYEGSGRGFALRFQALLQARSRGRHPVRLRQPIRWAEDDPLEALVFRLLLLDAEPGPAPTLPPPAPPLQPEDRDRLAADEARLRRLFGLLVTAHYRTRPSDLRHLLDGPNLHLFAHDDPQGLACCALVAEEGGFAADFADAIWRGERRPHGHLLPESLAVHLGLAEAPRLRGARVVRLAVHPQRQGQGLGSALLAALRPWCAQRGLAYLGASFGATPRLLRFWRANGFLPVRVSLGRSAMSGEHSVLVLGALDAAGAALLNAARARFAEALPHALADHLRHLEPALVDALLPELPPLPGTPRPGEVHAYAHHRRLLEAAMAPLTLAAWRGLTDPALRARLDAEQRHALILRLLQKRDWTACAEALGMAGRRAVDALLRDAFRRLLD